LDEEELPSHELRDKEELVLVAGKHWFLMLKPLLWTFLGLIIVFVVLRIGGASIYFTVAFFLWLALGMTYFIANYIVWARTKYFLTNMRIIVDEQKSLFAKEITEIELENIHNVSYKISGVVSAGFNFGNVILQSFGAPKPLILKNVSKPARVHLRISQMMAELHEEEEQNQEIEPKIKHPRKYIPRAPHLEEDNE